MFALPTFLRFAAKSCHDGGHKVWAEGNHVPFRRSVTRFQWKHRGQLCGGSAALDFVYSEKPLGS